MSKSDIGSSPGYQGPAVEQQGSAKRGTEEWDLHFFGHRKLQK